MLLVRSAVNRLGDYFRIRNRRWIDRCSAPSDIERHTRKVDNASIAAIAAQIVRRAHEDAVHRARLDAQCTKHALRIVDRVAGDLEALAVLDALLADVNAIDGASLRTLIARDAGREIKSMKAAISRGHRHRKFRVLEMFGKRLALGPIRFDPCAERHPHSMRHRVHRVNDVPHPWPYSLNFIDHRAERYPFIEIDRCDRAYDETEIGGRTSRLLPITNTEFVVSAPDYRASDS